MTDGYAVSIQLRNNDKLEKNQEKKQLMKDARREAKILYKTLEQDEIEKIKIQKELDKKEKKEKEKLERKQERDRKKAEFKKLSKHEQQEQRIKEKFERDKKNKEKYIEFPYLEDLNDTEYENLKNEDIAVLDPGKRDLIRMMNRKGVIFRYSNKQHLRRTKRRKYQRHIENKKKKMKITELEEKLMSYNSKSCNYDKFKGYIRKKNEINKKVIKKYENIIFRKYKWYGYINRQKADTALIKDIKKKFGNPTIIYGDWSKGEEMKHMISTPNIRLKRKIAEHFKVYRRI